MSLKFHFQIILAEGKPTLSFGSDYNRARFKQFLKDNIGKYGTIEPREKISMEARGYFEGALIPAYLEWSGVDPESIEQHEIIRETFKQEFNGMVVNGLENKPIVIARSTSRLSREEFKSEFIAKIVDYFVENNITVPNVELYKKWKNKWRDSIPLLSYWQFLNHYKLKCDMGVEEVTYIIPVDTKKINYPNQDTTITAF